MERNRRTALPAKTTGDAEETKSSIAKGENSDLVKIPEEMPPQEEARKGGGEKKDHLTASSTRPILLGKVDRASEEYRK